jgi:hypothetical protein
MRAVDDRVDRSAWRRRHVVRREAEAQCELREALAVEELGDAQTQVIDLHGLLR